MTRSGRLVLFGTGGFASELVGPARHALASPAGREFAGGLVATVDDATGDDTFLGLPVVPVGELTPADAFIVAVGDGTARGRIHEGLVQRGLTPFGLHDLTAHVGPGVAMGAGVVLARHVTITANVSIGRQFQCNIYSYVAHDCVVGDDVTFAPRVSCNGNVTVGDRAYVGTGALLRQGTRDRPLTIGEDAVVGMGAVVTKDVPAGTTVVGNPARPLAR